LLLGALFALVWFVGHAPKAHAQTFDSGDAVVDASGDGGVSEGGNGGIAFFVGGSPQPPASPPGLADLAVTKTAPAHVANCGLACAVQATVTVRNVGGQTASAVTLADTSSLVAVSGNIVSLTATPSQGTCGAPAGGVINCSFGDLAPGASLTVTLNYVLHIDVNPATLTDTATASTPTPEVSTANNTATSTTANP
jgi:hypothetical protein